MTSKGFHVYLRTNEPIGNRTLAWSYDGRKRIETRGEGGYITAPPSRHASGHVYCWLWGDATAVPVLSAAAVTAVLAAAAHFDQRPKREQPQTMLRETAVPPPHGDAFIRLQRYAHAALHHEVTALSAMPPGGRNDGLNRAAFCLGRYVGAGCCRKRWSSPTCARRAAATASSPTTDSGPSGTPWSAASTPECSRP
ncbi:MAG: bifunctional DNA primase/polymerase [Chloroflexi bacterium]|nr:bifunctional DNA primase/polymerase [Chloroflexota bacterium]